MRNPSSYDSLVLFTGSQNAYAFNAKELQSLKEPDGSLVAPVCAGSLLAA